ncbi:MAG: HlyC/CorC family transporter [Phycisphaerales bacterium]|nr:HlyC/CorC family transporter [Phycisphaerales bacterium]
MNKSLWIILSVLVLALLITATITITLRRYSRALVAELLRRSGREKMFERLAATQNELAQCLAVVRTSCTMLLVLMLYHALYNVGFEPAWQRYALAFVLALSTVIVFAVAIPSAWAKYAGEPFLIFSLPALFALRTVMYPLLLIANFFDGLVRRLAGVPEDHEEDDAARHERDLLDAVSEGMLVGAVNEEEQEMIESVMELRDTDASEIMTPRTEIEGAEVNVTLDDVKALIGRIGHSRIPIFEETIDNIVGIIYAKDLLQIPADEPFDARKTMREPHFVPETKNLRDLLHEFRNGKVHLAIVLDEYGGTAGLVTIEDILEELVGEIVDEYDEDEPEPLTRIDDYTVEIDARMRVDELNEELGLTLPEEDDYETIGGFVSATLGRIPQTGETCVHENVELHVLDAEPRRINRIRLQIQPTNGNGKLTG